MAILEAARDLLASEGIDGLSMRVVADRVGISATAIYHYFQSKQDLVNRVVGRAFERFGAYLQEAADSHPEGSLARISALGEAYLRFALENQAYFRVMFSIQAKDPREQGELPEGGGYHLLRRAVADAVRAGTLRSEEPDLVAMFLWSCVHGLVTLSLCGASDRCHVDGVSSSLGLYRMFESLVADGIRARPQRVQGELPREQEAT
jgi:AcrR family transcriptional regulator